LSRTVAAWALAVAIATGAVAALSPELERALRDAKYVYVQSERKTGELGRPAEIWFFYDGGPVYVGTRPASWRVRRIKAGRRRARIAIGKVDGPSFEATGEVVRDAAVEEKLLAAFAHKYPEGWSRHEDAFRNGFKSGERVLVRYTPR
jgi:hypothetical protein